MSADTLNPFAGANGLFLDGDGEFAKYPRPANGSYGSYGTNGTQDQWRR